MDWRALSLGGHNGLEGTIIGRSLWIGGHYHWEVIMDWRALSLGGHYGLEGTVIGRS